MDKIKKTNEHVQEIYRRKEIKEEAERAEQKARKDLLNYLLHIGVDTVHTDNDLVTVQRRHRIDEDKLREKHPQIFMSGMKYKFDERKAKRYYPKNVLENALKECSKGVSEFVKVQRKPK